jgi:predicted transposase/invertase (TIGR01784 family)
MATFYTCRNDRAFKEVFLNPNNSDLLKALLEFILKIKIDKLEIKKTELLSGNVNIKDKRVDAIVHTGNKKIEIEINSQNKDYLHTRSTAYICNIYQSNASVGDTYNEDTDIIQVNLTWGLGRNNDEMKIYKIMNEKGELYVKNFIIYEINMDYYDKIWYSKNEEEIKKNQYMIMLDLDKKELKNMPKDKIVDKYITNVTIVNNDPEFQKYMSEEEDKKKIQNSLLSEAKEEGISQGISQGYTSGINDGIKQTAKNLLSMNMTLEDISKATGLSIEEINKLK